MTSLPRGYLFIVCITIVIFWYTITNLHYYYTPNPDVFEYLTEGKLLLRNWGLWIATPPLYSILISLFDLTLPLKYPGISGGILFNAICLTLSIVLLWKQSERFLGNFVFLPILIFLTHPITARVNLQPSNFTPAMLLILLALNAHTRFPSLSYLLVVVAFFFRYEAIAVYPILLILDILQHKTFRSPFASILSLIPIVTWIIRGVSEDTVYRPEYAMAYYNFPNIGFIRETFSSHLFNFVHDNWIIAFLAIVWIVAGVTICFKKKILPPVAYSLFIFFYSVIHILFPASTPRYAYLILPFTFVLFYWPAIFIARPHRPSQKFMLGILLLASAIILLRNGAFRAYQSDLIWDRADKRFSGEWIRSSITKPTIVYAFMNDIMEYYATGAPVEFKRRYYPQELIQTICDNEKDILVIISNELAKRRYYYSYADGGDFEMLFKDSQVFPYFQLFKTLHIELHTNDIYKYEAGGTQSQRAIRDLCGAQ